MQNREPERGLKNDGDTRIYDATKKRDTNETNIPGDSNNHPIRAGRLSAELQLDAAQRVLETLDKQINSLDELEQQQRAASGTKPTADYEQNYSTENYYHHFPKPEQQKPFSQEDHHWALVRAIEARKLALDYYVEHGLREDRCGCHFEHVDRSNVTDCLSTTQIHCQECGFAPVVDEQNPSGGNTLLNYIEQQRQQHQLKISRRKSNGDFLSTRRIGESSYRSEGQGLFIDDEATATRSESGLAPQGFKAKLGGCLRQNYSHYSYSRAAAAASAATTSDNSSIDSRLATQTRKERNLYEIERSYSQRLTGYRSSSSSTQKVNRQFNNNNDDDNYDSCSSESRIREEEGEIGNALVESDSRASPVFNSSNLSDLERHQFALGRGQLSANYSSEQCSLTDDNNNNSAAKYESENNNSSSSSSLSLSWSQDFLQTLSIAEYEHHEDEEALQLINSLFPRSCSEGRIDFELCTLNSQQQETRTEDYNGSDSDGHELSPRELRKQQRPRRRHNTGSSPELLHESCGNRYNRSSISFSVAAASDELDFCEITTATGSARGEQPASCSCEFRQQSCHCQQSVIDFDDGQRVQPARTEAAARPSMKVVRDIAKLSVPSLSALQYLPTSQLDQLAKRKLNNNKTKNKISNAMQNNPDQSAADNSIGRLKVIEESTGSAKHDESCLFHRLCMCSCVSRQPLADIDEDNSGSSAMNYEKSKKSNRSGSSRRRPKSVSPTNYGQKSEDKDKDESSSSVELSEEKQSPRFLSLLHIMQTPNSPNKKRQTKEQQQRTSQTNELSTPLNGHDSTSKSRAKAGGCQLRLGSDGNLIQSRASSAQDEEFSSDTESVNSSLPGRSPASLCSSAALVASVAAAAVVATNDDDSSLTKADGDDDDDDRQVRSKSACSTTRPNEVDDEGISKTKAYRRFLSPRRIFASSSPSRKEHPKSSGGGLESLVGKETSSIHQSANNQEPKSRPSFLSRSLTRLTSQRAAGRTAQISKEAKDNQPAQIDSSSSVCRSQTISIDSESLQSSPDKHLALAAPEIVLNTVEFQQDSSASLTMTRDASSLRLLTMTGATVSGAEFGPPQVDRACSLPASPRRYRRTSLSSGNTSPRLRESPISFRSPESMSTKIEDGLRVCSTEHFEKHIDNVKGNQDDAQAKLFKAWINHFHPNLIRHDLVEEFRDGIKLIGLLASLTCDRQLRQQYEKLSNDKQSYVNRLVTTPSSRLRQLSNVSIAIDYLRQKRHMKLVNLNPMDIVSGKQNVILGLCWNIILNFQLEQPNQQQQQQRATGDLNVVDSSLSSHKGGNSNVSYCTSRLSSNSTNEDGSKQRGVAAHATPTKLRSSKHQSTTSSLIEEYGTNDLIAAKRKLLERINHRFNLKLTNLTSNLMDGDVLLAIMKRLVPNIKDVDSFIGHDGDDDDDDHHQSWSQMSNEKKLDCCFDIAETHLGIPRLFDGSDLNSPDGAKSSLIYLSMLLNSEQALAKSNDHLAQEPIAPAAVASEPMAAEANQLTRIESYLNEIDLAEDKFEVGQLDSTLNSIKTLEKLVEGCGEQVTDGADENSQKVLNRCRRLREQANQIEALIKWINEADNLLEGSQQKSSKDLTESIEKYRLFFSPENLPKLETTLCPTLERQYRGCLSSAKQRVLSMEQTLKNWISYEEARKKLKEWLITSETKLANALNPASPVQLNEQQQLSVTNQKSPLVRHSERLDDLIEYFELENVDEDQMLLQQQQFTSEQMPISLMAHDLHHQHDSVSLSGSLISLGSTSSRMSNLQSSKKASYHKLFDDFELKCRLLAAGLDREQRESLLLGVKELRYRLRIITEQRVPQVVTELRMSISRCEMSIQEHEDENEDENENDLDEAESSLSELEARSTSTDAEPNQGKAPTQTDGDSERSHSERPFSSVSSSSNKKDQNKIVECTSQPADSSISQQADDDEPMAPVAAIKRSNNKSCQQTSRKSTRKSGRTRKRAKGNKNIKPAETDRNDEPLRSSTARRIWEKLVRAFRTSLPLNIVLLVCLAGLCVVPMLQKDACCGLAQQQIPATGNSVKPV